MVLLRLLLLLAGWVLQVLQLLLQLRQAGLQHGRGRRRAEGGS
jgi:hypothetical protein